MNNLFKIFLIFNLFSSATSSVNNYSLPLPETELKMGQNSSELVERAEAITLVGGTTVQGVWKESDNVYQRPCTLSFPVNNGGGRLGFLTSYSCSNTNFFVGDTEVGVVLPPHAFTPSLGLDYMFVLADWNWSTDSEHILFSEYINNKRFDRFLAMTTPTQPPFTNLPVCAFGGVKSKMVCGEILEFGVTIQVPVPGSDGEKSVDFSNVVKVNMTDDYDFGYMGAPVYIADQIPFSSQIVAHPVGQVVETLDQFQEDSKEPNIWYYTPIDRILEYSGVKLLLGDFSSSEEVPMGGKSSNPKLQERQDLVAHAGVIINIRVSNPKGKVVRTCTLGFAVRRPEGRGAFNQGYLTAASCAPSRTLGNSYEAFVLDGNGNEINVGTVTGTLKGYNPKLGQDYSTVRLRVNYWDPQTSMGILIDDRIVPVTDYVNPAKGAQVCFYGWYSGLVCGWIHSLDRTVFRTSPWLDANNQYPEDYFQHMVFVSMETNTKAQNDGKGDYDRGAGVFAPKWKTPPGQPKQLVSTQPVGIFADYNTVMEQFFIWRVPGTEDTTYFSYTPIKRMLDNTPGLELIETPKEAPKESN